MIYGVISDLDNETTRILFREKKIPNTNVVPSQQLGELVKRLRTGDTVYAISINRFYNVWQLFIFGRFCMAHGISLRFSSQPYLDIVNGKHWKNTVIEHIKYISEMELYCKGRLQQAFRMNNAQWDFLFGCIEYMNLEVLAHTFDSDGVLKRGG